MVRLIKQYAQALLKISREHGDLEKAYKFALKYLDGEKVVLDENTPEELKAFINLIDEKDIVPTLHSFVEIVREELKIVRVDVFSVIPLTSEQIRVLRRKLIEMSKKRIEIKNHIDSDLLGGIRIIMENKVIDNSIKSKLIGMKRQLYKGVYFK